MPAARQILRKTPVQDFMEQRAKVGCLDIYLEGKLAAVKTEITRTPGPAGLYESLDRIPCEEACKSSLILQIDREIISKPANTADYISDPASEVVDRHP